MDRLVEFMTDFPGIYEAHFTDAQMVELAMISERYSRVGIGKQAPIIDTLDVDGKPFNINTLSAKYVVVAFFSYDCQHCQEFMEEIGPFLKENPDFDLVGMAVIGSKREVRRMRRKNDLADRHFFWGEGEWDGVYTRAYAVNSLPAIFVLDEARKIVAKPLNVTDLYDFVDSVK